METVELSAKMDTTGLSRALPLAVSIGRRSLEEQCVTSMGWILVNGQRDTPKTEIATMDSELAVISTPVLATRGARKGLPLKSGKLNLATTQLTGAEMIVIARMHNPGISKTTGRANYNLLTGNRWALGLPGTSGVAEFLAWVQAAALRMVKGRHSSIAFLKAGYSGPIKKCFSSPLFQHSKKYRTAASAMRDATNPLTTVSPDKLGELAIADSVGGFTIEAENNVGEKSGNSVMDEQRRNALIVKSKPALQAAIDRETSNLSERGEFGVRMSDSLVEVQKMLG